MQGLKALVIFMGVLIVIGMGVLAYGLVTKFGKEAQMEKAKLEQAQISTVPVIQAPSSGMPAVKYKHQPAMPFGDVDALLPEGSMIIEFIPNKRRLLIVFKDAMGARAIKVINVANGNDMGTIHLDKAGTN